MRDPDRRQFAVALDSRWLDDGDDAIIADAVNRLNRVAGQRGVHAVARARTVDHLVVIVIPEGVMDAARQSRVGREQFARLADLATIAELSAE